MEVSFMICVDYELAHESVRIQTQLQTNRLQSCQLGWYLRCATAGVPTQRTTFINTACTRVRHIPRHSLYWQMCDIVTSDIPWHINDNGFAVKLFCLSFSELCQNVLTQRHFIIVAQHHTTKYACPTFPNASLKNVRQVSVKCCRPWAKTTSPLSKNTTFQQNTLLPLSNKLSKFRQLLSPSLFVFFTYMLTSPVTEAHYLFTFGDHSQHTTQCGPVHSSEGPWRLIYLLTSHTTHLVHPYPIISHLTRSQPHIHDVHTFVYPVLSTSLIKWTSYLSYTGT